MLTKLNVCSKNTRVLNEKNQNVYEKVIRVDTLFGVHNVHYIRVDDDDTLCTKLEGNARERNNLIQNKKLCYITLIEANHDVYENLSSE